MRKPILLLLCCAFAFQLAADDVFIDVNNYKYQVAKKVFDDLIEAKGDKRLQKPEFVMSENKRYVAWMNGKKTQIGLETAAYDVCIKYGKDSLNAIASLLSHEITHYYEKHSWGSEFATAFTALDVATTVKTNARSKDIKAMNETEADYLGGFLAYSAGYQTFGVMPKFLVDVYSTYGLPNKINGYPSLDDRTKLAVESELRLEELVNIFETANYLIVLKQYDVVDEYYTYILKEYQSREIFNNAGVNALMAALELFDDSEPQSKYVYPVQLDGETRMSRVKPRDVLGFAERKQKRNQLLQKAQFYFEQAKALDKTYGTALVNIAVVLDLKGEYEDAAYMAKKAIKLGKSNDNPKTISDGYIMRGIATIHEGETEDGRGYLERATRTEASRELAQLNLAILDNNVPDPVEPKAKFSLTKEKIDNINLDEFLSSIDVDNLLEITNDVSCGIKDLDGSRILLNLLGGGQKGYTLLHLTNKSYGQTSGDGIKIGSTRSDLVKKYGQPTYTQEARKGQFMVYDVKQIAFYVANDKVDSWCLYRTKTND